jgi:NAD(P)-dependent dehydrogenase (short-subunit alcohol dehydrogenase family)
MAQDVSKAVLVTGCSSGIGRATAEHLAKKGWNVYASARKVEAIGDLEQAGCKLLAIDVTDEASMQAGVAAVEAAEGAVGVLVNNAGYSQSGATEDVPLDVVRRQFETNVFGLVRMTQLAVPGMRRQGWGKVVNIGSMGGTLVFPGGGIYHASKYAVEALSDALRFELRGFGVDVVLIQPGLIRTRFGEVAVGSMDATAPAEGPYAKFNTAVAEATKSVYEKGPLAMFGRGPEAVAKAIEKAITSRRPRARYRVTPSARMLMTQRSLMSDRVWDAFLRSQFPRPS